jgi:hypothetical protein
MTNKLTSKQKMQLAELIIEYCLGMGGRPVEDQIIAMIGEERWDELYIDYKGFQDVEDDYGMDEYEIIDREFSYESPSLATKQQIQEIETLLSTQSREDPEILRKNFLDKLKTDSLKKINNKSADLLIKILKDKKKAKY